MNKFDAVTSIIQEKISNKESFTAWDITVAVKKSGIDTFHSSIRHIVHDSFDYGFGSPDYIFADYTFSERNWGKGRVRIYHHNLSNPDDYVAEIVERENKASQQTIPVDTKTVAHIKFIDDKNRLRFTKPVLDEAGFQAGNRLDVYLRDGEEIVLVPFNQYSNNDKDTYVNTYITDEYNNLRLSLKHIGLTANMYRITVANGRVYAEPTNPTDMGVKVG